MNYSISHLSLFRAGLVLPSFLVGLIFSLGAVAQNVNGSVTNAPGNSTLAISPAVEVKLSNSGGVFSDLTSYTTSTSTNDYLITYSPNGNAKVFVDLTYSESALPDVSCITTLDFTLINASLLGTTTLSNDQIVAGDVDIDGSLSISDLFEVRSLILGSTSRFSNQFTVD